MLRFYISGYKAKMVGEPRKKSTLVLIQMNSPYGGNLNGLGVAVWGHSKTTDYLSFAKDNYVTFTSISF